MQLFNRQTPKESENRHDRQKERHDERKDERGHTDEVAEALNANHLNRPLMA
tara:strand:+ start:1070 stop:1225 length:156 start_codon:yes stop_codon:yes gene_type:complete